MLTAGCHTAGHNSISMRQCSDSTSGQKIARSRAYHDSIPAISNRSSSGTDRYRDMLAVVDVACQSPYETRGALPQLRLLTDVCRICHSMERDEQVLLATAASAYLSESKIDEFVLRCSVRVLRCLRKHIDCELDVSNVIAMLDSDPGTAAEAFFFLRDHGRSEMDSMLEYEVAVSLSSDGKISLLQAMAPLREVSQFDLAFLDSCRSDLNREVRSQAQHLRERLQLAGSIKPHFD